MDDTEVPTLGKLETEFTPAYQAWKTSATPQTRGELLRAVSPVLDTAIRSYGGGSTGSPTLRGKARHLALQAFDTYNPDRGTLKTHLLSHLQRLHRLGGQEQHIISVPERVLADRQRLDDTEATMRDWLGRDPSDSELADELGISLKRIQHVRQWRPAVSAGRYETGELGEDVSAPGVVSDNDDDGWRDYVYHSLSPTDQIIMGHALGLYGRKRLTPAEVAAKLRISQSAVSQRAAKIQQLLDERNSLDLL